MNVDVKSDKNLQTHKDLWKTNKKEKDETITVKSLMLVSMPF